MLDDAFGPYKVPVSSRTLQLADRAVLRPLQPLIDALGVEEVQARECSDDVVEFVFGNADNAFVS